MKPTDTEANTEKNNVENLLKKVLRDDLPGEVETVMKRQLDGFREKMAAGRPRQQPRFTVNPGPLRLLFNRGVLAFASILMLVTGSLMQMSGPRGVLADSISARDAALHTFTRIRSADAMECTVEASGEGEQTIRYTIEWLPSGRSRATAGTPGNGVEKTLWVNKDEEGSTVEDIDDPVFRRVRQFLSSQALGNLLDGKWKLERYRREGECEYGTFTIDNPRDNAQMEITTDLCTSLPVTMAVTLPHVRLDIRFMWTAPPPSLLFSPGIYEKNKKESPQNTQNTQKPRRGTLLSFFRVFCVFCGL